jgi:hypothetical protein
MPVFLRLRTFERIVFSQRVSFPILRQKNPSEIRMPLEYYSEHVKTFSFVPISTCPNRCNRVDMGVILWNLSPHSYPVKVFYGIKVIYNFESRFLFTMVINATKILEVFKK